LFLAIKDWILTEAKLTMIGGATATLASFSCPISGVRIGSFPVGFIAVKSYSADCMERSESAALLGVDPDEVERIWGCWNIGAVRDSGLTRGKGCSNSLD
jgi:hypothetical protein